jgi:hypothetical protein
MGLIAVRTGFEPAFGYPMVWEPIPIHILEQLIYPIDWTDDVTFLDDQGNAYMIDDLHDRVVEVGDKRYRVDVEGEEVEEMP